MNCDRIQRPLAAAALLSLVAVNAAAQEIPTPPEISNIGVLTRTVSWAGVASSIGVILMVSLLLGVVDKAVSNLGTQFAERRLVLHRLNQFFRFFVYLITIWIVILLSFNLSEQVLTLIGGASAVAVGFATKDLVASFVAGVMVIFDRPFQVGDRVRFGGEYGDIIAIGLRSVRLRTLDDSTVTIPNSLFLSEVALSGNSGSLDMQTVLDFYIAVDQDAQWAQELVTEAAATSPYIYLAKPIAARISQYMLDNCIALRVRLKAYVFDTQFEEAFKSDVTLRVMECFAEEGIQPPAILYRGAADLAAPVDDMT